MNTSKKPKRVLILALSGIGNFVMQSPVFTAIKKRYPDWHITVWVAPRGTKALAANNPYIDEVIEAPIKQSVTDHLKLTWRLTKGRFKVGIALSPGQLWKSAAYLFLAGTSERIGNTYPYLNSKHSAFLLTKGIPELPELHDIEQNLRLLEPLDINLPTSLINYITQVPQASRSAADEFLKELSIETGKKIIGMHPGSAPDFLWKRWPAQNFISVGRELISKYNAHVLVFGGPEEAQQKKEIQQALGHSASCVATDLLTTAAILQRCALLLSNDSGLMHLSASVGTPTFGLFGPTNEKQTGPRGLQSFVIRAPRTSPVYITENQMNLGDKPHETMLAITPEMVLNQLSSILR